MRKIGTFLAVVVFCWVGSGLCQEPKLNYPTTRTTPTKDVYFGMEVNDPYRWLEDGKSLEVKAWVSAQDRLARKYLSNLPGRNRLSARLKKLLYVASLSLPKKEGGRLFYTRSSTDKEKAVFYWREGDGGQEHVLLDPTTLGSGGHLSVGEWYPSPDGREFAYQLKKNNSDEAELHVRNVDTGQELADDEIPGANFADVTWAPNSQGFYYMRLPTDSNVQEEDRVAKADIRFHHLGSDSSRDPEIYPPTGDSSLYLSPSVSRDGNWLFVYVINGWSSTNVYVRDQQDPSGSFKPLFVSTSATAAVTEWKGNFYIYTNEGAPHYRVLKTDVHHPGKASWKVIIPERSDRTLTVVKLVGGRLWLTTINKASSQLETRELDGTLVRTLPLPEVGSVDDISGTEDADEGYYDFQSFSMPPQIYTASLSTGRTTLWANMDVPVDPTPYQMEQVWYPSKDGTLISMFIAERKGLKHDGTTPFLLQGYGGFSEPMLPRFHAEIYPWLEAGGGYAIPNLRGGGEYGESWHQAGMLTHKQNTFDDFIAAAEYLIAKGYTRKGRLVIQGVSNGGLLVGAVLTQSPDLFKAVVCKVPLLDMLRYPLFGEGPAWISEYGSPKDETQFKALFAYSPYHHVQKETAYPSVLLISAENDDRVDPMYARKMTAALQAATSTQNPILLETLKNAGHGGSDRKKALIEEFTDRLAFLMNEVGIIP